MTALITSDWCLLYLQERRIQQNLHAEEKKIQMELAHQNAIRYGLCARCVLEANMRPIIGLFPLSCEFFLKQRSSFSLVSSPSFSFLFFSLVKIISELCAKQCDKLYLQQTPTCDVAAVLRWTQRAIGWPQSVDVVGTDDD